MLGARVEEDMKIIIIYPTILWESVLIDARGGIRPPVLTRYRYEHSKNIAIEIAKPRRVVFGLGDDMRTIKIGKITKMRKEFH